MMESFIYCSNATEPSFMCKNLSALRFMRDKSNRIGTSQRFIYIKLQLKAGTQVRTLPLVEWLGLQSIFDNLKRKFCCKLKVG